MLCFFLAQILQNRVVLPNTTHNLLRSVRVRFLFYSRSLEWELTVYIGKSFSRSTIWDVAQLSSSNILEVMIERRNFPKKPPTHTLGTGGGWWGGIAVLLSTSDCTSNLPDWIQDISRIIIWFGWSEVKNAPPDPYGPLSGPYEPWVAYINPWVTHMNPWVAQMNP